MVKFVVLEGLDGSGKSTQIKLLRDYLNKLGIAHQYLHFPRMDAPVFGELIARFLRGEFGRIEEVNPYLIALLYAGDRQDAGKLLREWLSQGYFVLVDRYVISNIAFQCAKIEEEDKRLLLRDWILNMEYNYMQIPQPDMNIFLDVPFEFTVAKLSAQRKGQDRDYLNGNTDIHENDLSFQKQVRQVYLSFGPLESNFKIINCGSSSGEILPPEDIFKKIIQKIF